MNSEIEKLNRETKPLIVQFGKVRGELVGITRELYFPSDRPADYTNWYDVNVYDRENGEIHKIKTSGDKIKGFMIFE